MAVRKSAVNVRGYQFKTPASGRSCRRWLKAAEMPLTSAWGRCRRGLEEVGVKKGRQRNRRSRSPWGIWNQGEPGFAKQVRPFVGLYPGLLFLLLLFLLPALLDFQAQHTGMPSVEGLGNCTEERLVLAVGCQHPSPGCRLQNEPVPAQSRHHGNQAQHGANRPHKPVHRSKGRLLSACFARRFRGTPQAAKPATAKATFTIPLCLQYIRSACLSGKLVNFGPAGRIQEPAKS